MNAPRLSRANTMIHTLTTTHDYGRASFRFYLNLFIDGGTDYSLFSYFKSTSALSQMLQSDWPHRSPAIP